MKNGLKRKQKTDYILLAMSYGLQAGHHPTQLITGKSIEIYQQRTCLKVKEFTPFCHHQAWWSWKNKATICKAKHFQVIKGLILKGVHPIIFVWNIFPNLHLIQKCIHNWWWTFCFFKKYFKFPKKFGGQTSILQGRKTVF